MAAITYSNDGAKIFIAAQNADTGQQYIIQGNREGFSGWFAAYGPAAGPAANVLGTVEDDTVYFYGNFGTGISVLRHKISTSATTDISPADTAANVVNALAINPTPHESGNTELICHLNGEQDMKRSTDGGATWVDLDNATGVDATALWVQWYGGQLPHTYYYGGETTGTGFVKMSPNNGNKEQDITGSIGATNIVSLEAARI